LGKAVDGLGVIKMFLHRFLRLRSGQGFESAKQCQQRTGNQLDISEKSAPFEVRKFDL
jgi:hypothetical protein